MARAKSELFKDYFTLKPLFYIHLSYSTNRDIEIIRKHRKSGKSYQSIADYLNQKNLKPKRGGTFKPSSVGDICRRLRSA
ncbi:recombinase family protein [Chamaesiphon sp. OTE_8_metabat_110]|uniref:recombinase family protein n=1 Tax=Chamaesiphon sp. OTE_8_metabat_110 TaxID=2964696 RepID=UPI0037C0ACF6